MRADKLSAGYTQTIFPTPVVPAPLSTLSRKLVLVLLFVEEPNSAHGHSNHFTVFLSGGYPCCLRMTSQTDDAVQTA